MEAILCDLPHVCVYLDDILITCESEAAHLRNLSAVPSLQELVLTNCVGSAARHFSGACKSANSGEGLIKYNQLCARAHDLIPRWKPNLRNGLRRAKC